MLKGKKIKILSLILLLSFSLPVLAGCWNYRDIEDYALVMGLAVDKDKTNNNYLLTIEMINQHGQSSQFGADGTRGQTEQSSQSAINTKSFVVETEGVTMLDAIRNAITFTGRKLFWGHCKVIIISEDVAKNEGLIPIIDLFWREAETRPDMYGMISKEKTAGEILKANSVAGDVVSLYLDDAITYGKSVSKYYSPKLLDFTSDLADCSGANLVSTVYIKQADNIKILCIEGMAVFKGDKLVYFLNGDETQIALLIKDELKGGIFNIDEKHFKTNTRVALEVYQCKTKQKPLIKNNKLIMQVDSDIYASISEVQGSVNYIGQYKRDLLAKDAEKFLNDQIIQLVHKTQQNYSTDIFNFNETIKRKMPGYWMQTQPHWYRTYQNVIVQPNVKVHLTISSASPSTVKVGGE